MNHTSPVPGAPGGALPNEPRLVRWLTVALFLLIALDLALPFFSHLPWMTLLQDDFFYYLKVAQNVAHGRGSTFNGIVPTNGYQPLFAVLVIALSELTERPGLILGSVALLSFVAAAVTFVLAHRLLRGTGVRPLLAFALSAWITAVSLATFFYGMEVTLTIPIMLGVMCLFQNVAWLERSALHTFAFGLLLSAMVLSRIDTLIFGGLLLAGIGLSPELRGVLRPRLLLGAALGLLPVLLYFAFNHHFFQTWLPVSGMAKQLKSNHVPSGRPWRSLTHSPTIWYNLVILASSGLLARVFGRLRPADRVLFPATLLFPYLYYLVLSIVSDWSLWPWYWYPLRPALLVAFLLPCMALPTSRWFQRSPVVVLLVLSVFAYLGVHRWTRQQVGDYAAARMIERFETTHPGIYAMGDRAGRVGYLLHSPVIQTEGLMMDRPYLSFVARRTPLREVLARYNVRYYIGTAYSPYTGCFEASEPAMAGPASAHMRGEFCETPVASSLDAGELTLIFDLHPERR